MKICRSVVAAGAIGLVGWFGQQMLLDSADRQSVAAKAVRAQMQVDMMHDALNSDVLASMLAASSRADAARFAEIRDGLAEHIATIDESVTVRTPEGERIRRAFIAPPGPADTVPGNAYAMATVFGAPLAGSLVVFDPGQGPVNLPPNAAGSVTGGTPDLLPPAGAMDRSSVAATTGAGASREIKEWQAIMDFLRGLPVKNKGDLPVIPVDERAAEARAGSIEGRARDGFLRGRLSWRGSGWADAAREREGRQGSGLWLDVEDDLRERAVSGAGCWP